MKKRITLIADENKHPGCKSLMTADRDIRFEHEKDNLKDPDAIKVFCNNQLAGYVANSERIQVKGTVSASNLKNNLNNETLITISSIEDITDKDFRFNTYIIEVNIERKKDPNDLPNDLMFTLEGSQSIFPEKLNTYEKIKNGEEVRVSLRKTDRGIEVFTVNNSIGCVKSSSLDYNKIENAVCSKNVSGKVSPESTIRSIKVIVDLSGSFEIFEEQVSRIITEGILTSEEVMERIEYMTKELRLDEKNVNSVLSTIDIIPEENRGRLVKHLQTKFIDYHEYLKESIICINKNKFLRFVGSKATGKNTAADTLCWLYNRPKGEVSMNEEIDKVDLLGSRVIDSDYQGNMIMPFELSTFVEGLQKGWFLILDEVNTVNPSLLTILHGLDARRSIDIPGYGTVKVHPKASVILTMNEDYVGTSPLNEATVDRFTPIIFEDADNIKDMLKAAVPTALLRDLNICQKFYEIQNKLFKDGKISSYSISIRGFVDALDLAEDLGLKRSIQINVVNKGIDSLERMVLNEQLSLFFNEGY